MFTREYLGFPDSDKTPVPELEAWEKDLAKAPEKAAEEEQVAQKTVEANQEVRGQRLSRGNLCELVLAGPRKPNHR